MNLPDKDWFRPDEVAKHFGVHKSTVYRWIESGKMEAVKLSKKLIRISKKAIIDFPKEIID